MIGYGSPTQPAGISSAEIQQLIEKRPSSSGIGLIRLFVTIGEVALAFVPGLGPVASTGIALGAAGIQTGLDYSETGSVSGVGAAINFGTALIPGVTHGIGAGVRNVRSIPRILEAAEKETILAKRQLTRAFNRHVAGEIGPERFGTFERLARGRQLGAKIAERTTEKINFFRSPARAYSKYGSKLTQIVREKGSTITQSGALGALQDIGINYKAVAAVRGLGETSDETEELIRKSLSKTGLAQKEILELSELLATVGSREARASIAIDYYRSIGKLDKLREAAPEIVKDVNKVNNVGFKASLEQNQGKQWVKSYVKSIKNPNSAAFNDNFVQKVQLIFDGNDAGRAPIEYVYRKLKDDFKIIFKRTDKALRKYKKFDDAFTATGGTLINSSVIMGYKVIYSKAKGQLIQISFYPSATRSRKNPNGKHPVYVLASDSELKHLRDRGMSYYLKKWAIAKNGNSGSFGNPLIKGIFSHAASFINIQGLRNILSLASNITQSLFDKGISHSAAFTKEWRDKFVKSFSKNWKNRLGRLTGRVIIGGAATRFLGSAIGGFIGREAQRLSSQVLIPIISGKHVTGYQLKVALATSVQGNLRRGARRVNPNSHILQTLSRQRKGGIIQRTPGSFTAGKLALSKVRLGK